MLSSQLRGVLLITLCCVAVAGVANAQVQTALDAQAAELGAPELGEVIVTGTRLQAGFQAPTPVTVLGNEQLQQQAPTDIADVVTMLPSFRQTATNSEDQRGNGNSGQDNLDLRGLGVQRVLILVDGDRVVPTNLNGTYDVNLIPTELVDRVEVVTGGASAAYGSDAVSGVVNFILKDRMNGFQASAQYGVSQYDDAKEPAFSFAGGTDFADGRGHFVVGGDYSDNQGVGTIYNRPWSAEQPCEIAFGSKRGTNLPAEGLENDCTYSTQAAGGVINAGPLKGTAFGPNGQPYELQYGNVYSNLMYGGPANPADPTANPFGNWFLDSPHRRTTLLGRVSFDLTPSTSVYAEYAYGAQKQNGLSTYHQDASLVIDITNPYIPTSIYNAMVADHLTSFTLGRFETDYGGYKLFDQDTADRFNVGIKGKLFADWTWDAHYSHGVTNSNQAVNTNIIEANYLESLYAVMGPTGVPICGPVATNPNLPASRAAQVTPGCQPLNIFGLGTQSPGALAYNEAASNNIDIYRQDNVAANIRGSAGSTWAGPIAVALGAEWRHQFGSSQTTPLGEELAFLSNNGVTYSGQYSVTEGYAEAGVPLAKDLIWAKSLDLNAAVRETDYTTSGSVTTWKAGLVWQPLDSLRLRYTRSRDIRAPAISDLFSASTQGITASAFNPITGQTGPEYTVGGGNPLLKPEVANSYTGGMVFQPVDGPLTGFSASIDYFNISIANVITTISAANIETYCAEGLTSYCPYVQEIGGAPYVTSLPENLQRLITNGIDLELFYRVPLGSIPGRLDAHFVSTWTQHLTEVEPQTTIDLAGSLDNGGVPRDTTNLYFTYSMGPMSNMLEFRYVSENKGDATLVGPGQPGYSPTAANSININLFPPATYVDWAFQYALLSNGKKTLQLFGGINNLLNKNPPFGVLIIAASGGNPYDIVGRYYKVGVRLSL